ncbi:late competence development ComFB family protein [Synechococcus sp. PCC 7335]|uniref:late competence development ComFB family protein n=1 Tax=Synechococcus sp. (strain ATCC 29403 / PCC 7335) TaxID=91464 RepID=UPI00057086AF|nr:late competence development ComFB family protein [Synechococcus sp. PCC 7335]
MSSIRSIVEQALQDGYLTPAMEAEVARICDTASELSVEEYTALDQLMSSLLTGEVVAVPRKQFINVMEELVLTEAISQVAQAEGKTDKTLDLGDVAAYALNRLPPLYATTEEGADYQRENARAELTELIAYQVSESVGRSLDQPEFFPERKELQRSEEFGLLGQVNQLLKDYARDFEQAPKVA